MGGVTLPTPSTPGYTSFRGRTACVCLAAWLPVYERLLLARGLIKSSIDVWQLTGGAPASGGTHTQGGAYDLLYQTTPAHVAVAREMGAGAWGRTVSQGFTKDHQHGVLYGCPHNSPALYQYTAMRNGYNGLGQATSGRFAGMWGYGHPDEYPAPSAWRTWRQGIAWAEVEIARLTAPTPPTPAAPAQEDDMTPEQAKRLDDIYAAITGLRSEEKGRYQVASGRFAWTSGVLRTLAAQNGAVVDEQAIASSIAAELAPSLAASLAESVQRLAPAASVEDVRKAAADAVRDVLGALDNPAS